jgi:DNA-binding transcriptional ArsR family regulator
MNAAFQALGDPTRREILRLLRRKEMSAGELAERFSLAKSTLSGHFNILKNAGLIVAERSGTTIVYSLNMSVVEQTMAAVMELFEFGKSAKETGKPKDIGKPKEVVKPKEAIRPGTIVKAVKAKEPRKQLKKVKP